MNSLPSTGLFLHTLPRASSIHPLFFLLPSSPLSPAPGAVERVPPAICDSISQPDAHPNQPCVHQFASPDKHQRKEAPTPRFFRERLPFTPSLQFLSQTL